MSSVPTHDIMYIAQYMATINRVWSFIALKLNDYLCEKLQFTALFNNVYFIGLGIGGDMLKKLSQVCIIVSINSLHVILFFIKRSLTGQRLCN